MGIPASKVAYVEIGTPEDERRIGFGGEQPDARMPPSLLDRRLLFVTGKGGVGKTTIASALGLLAAQQGKRTLVCEVDAKGNLADFFEIGETRFEPVEVQPASSPCRWTPRSRSRST